MPTKPEIKRYILKNKNKDLIEFEIIKSVSELAVYSEKMKIKDIISENKHLLPKKLSIELTNNTLKDFIRERKAPTSREMMKEMLNIMDLSNNVKFLDYSLALSLNDTYWICPKDKNYKWEDINLYKNQFSKKLQYIAFGISFSGNDNVKRSPELTTDGVLRKCWIRENDEIFLLKSNGSLNKIGNGYLNKNNLEIFSEYYVSQINEIFCRHFPKFKNIEYDIAEYHGELVSKCKLFTDENTSYIPMYSYFKDSDFNKKNNEEFFIKKISKIMGDENYEDLAIFDAIIGNRDRHLGNFGFLVNANTNKEMPIFPIFDNGESILNYANLERPFFFDEYGDKLNKFNQSFSGVLSIYLKPKHMEFLKELSNFKLKKHKKYNLDDEILKNFENYIRDIGKTYYEFLKLKYDKKIINQK